MKKTLLLTAVAALGMAASAQQTVIVPPTAAEAQAANYEALWGSYNFGYVLPNNTTVVDNDVIKVVVDNGSATKPGANIACVTMEGDKNVGSNINTHVFDRAFVMGSAAGDGAFEPVYALELISDGIKQPYAIFNVTAKEAGTLEMYCNRGNNKFTIYVWDKTLNDAAGGYVAANVAHAQDLGKELITPIEVSLTKGHEYWIFGSGTGSNINMYQMTFTPCTAPEYSITEFDATKYSTVIVPPTAAEAETAKYEALWGDYKYGYVLPNNTVVADNAEIKVAVNNGSASKPGANIACVTMEGDKNVGSNINTHVFDRSFVMGSAAGDGSFEPVYALELISDGIKQPYAIFEVEAKEGGALTMFSNRGNNKYTIYVWDRTLNDEAGAYALSNVTHAQDLGKELITETTIGLTKGHNYWIFCSGTGSNVNMYAMGYNTYTSPNYSYTGTTGITDVTVDAATQSNVIYNFQGQVVDENYKGFVIKNGKKYLQK